MASPSNALVFHCLLEARNPFCTHLKYQSLLLDWEFLEDRGAIINVRVPVLCPRAAQSDYPYVFVG